MIILNYLRPNISMYILHTVFLYISNSTEKENLVKNQGLFSFAIISPNSYEPNI